MKKTKNRAIIIILSFLLLVSVSLFTIFHGIGKQHKGIAKHIDLGLDLAGGVSITYEINEKNPSDKDISDTIYKLQKRVEQYSTESEVYKVGQNRIAVEIPGVTDANAILEELGKPGNLMFLTSDNNTVLTGADIVSAEPNTIDKNGISENVVFLTMGKEGTKAFAEATQKNIGKPIYIVYDGEVVSSPTVKSAITDGQCVIEGMESFESASNLASTIRIGALPLTLKELQSNVVGAKLGANAVSSSLKAGAIAIALIILLLVFLYRLPGLLSGLALCLYIMLDLLAINGFDVTLTLPGIAGVLLAIGMAVDANVIIFSRIQEELAAGKSVKNAIDNGYQKAFSAIFDGNITTLIAAVILWMKGSGTVRGFAQTLGIGILLSMFTALFVTKQLMLAAYHLGFVDEKYYGKAKKRKLLPVSKISKKCMIFSLIMIMIGFIALPMNQKRIGNILNYDLEFSGGTNITMTLNQKTDKKLISQMEDTLKDTTKVKSVQSQTVAKDNKVILKTSELTLEQRKNLESAMKKKYKIKEYEVQEITASISNEMRQDAIVAVIIASICMLIYIAFRFKDIRFAASAVMALLHDVLFVFMIYAVGKLSVGSTFIACMLTIFGYSINATIVIFDRIRENLNNSNLRNKGLDALVDTSVTQTLTRSINTTLTSLIPVLLLFFMGVHSIKEFTFTLICGLIIGVYSSICITGPLWAMLSKNKKKAK